MWLKEVGCCLELELADRFPPALVGRFVGESCCVTWPFSSLLYRKVKTQDESQILVHFSDVVPRPLSTHRIAPMGLRFPFDFATYVSETSEKKKLRILNDLTEACMLIAASHGWDTKPFEEAREQLIERKFQYPFLSKKRWRSPDGTRVVRIGIEMDIEITAVFLLVTGRSLKPTEKRIPIRQTRTSMLTVGLENKLAESAQWTDDITFTFSRGTPRIGAGRITTLVNVVNSQSHEVRER
jgi:hypothetical protein